jgi:protease-4
MRRLLQCLCIATLLPFSAGQAGAAAPAKPDKKADAKPVVAVFRLSGSVSELPADDFFSFAETSGSTLRDLVTRMKKAAKDPDVKAIAILAQGGTAGLAQTEELRQALSLVQAAGKEIYAYADSLTMREYVLLAGASRLSVVPTGDLWINGVHGETPYVRGLLNLIGAQPDFLTCGAFKSAAELFMRDGPSPEAEQMQNWLLDSAYETQLNLIAKGRKVDMARAKEWVNNGPYSAEKAKAAGLIDAVEFKQDFDGALKSKFGKDVVLDQKYGKKKSPKLDLSSPFAIFKILGDMAGESQKKKGGKSAVGIVHVNGAISLGTSEASPFGVGGASSSAVRKALDEAAKDDSVKAVVLRIDSPGGSAVASEIILDATRRVKAKKPFVVSMGDVAGSGGYYVACASDVIFADETTITGSIGVVSGKVVTTGAWKKIGITFKSYKRGENAGMLSSDAPFSKSERERMQGYMDEIYEVFKGHVVAIRGKKLTKPIDELAGGRVYTGKQALELGLVDKIGTLEDAIQYVAKEAKISDYDVREIPEPKSFIEKILEEASGNKDDSVETRALRLPTGGRFDSLVDLAMPYIRNLDPERLQVVKLALQRLQLIQQEGAVLMMPELLIRR